MDMYLEKNKAILFIALFFIAVFSYISFATAEIPPNLPPITAKEAIDIAEDYVKNKHIDVSKKYLAVVAYFTIHGDYFWQVEYRMTGTVKGGQTYINVHKDKQVTVTSGE